METIIISAVIAAFAAVFATVAIERLGGRMGGLIGTLPSTIVPASLGFWVENKDLVAFQHALYAVPAGMVLNAAFLYVWRWLPPKLPPSSHGIQLIRMVFLSLLFWLALGLILLFVLSRLTGHPLANGVFFTAFGFCLGIWGCRKRLPAPKGQRPITRYVLLARGIFAALAIGSAVWISGQGMPIVAGLASVFPAIFLTTMVSVWLSQGEAVVIGAVGPMMLGGVSVSIFALLAAWLFPILGLGWGCVASWGLSAAFVSVPAWLWLSRPMPD